MNLSIDTVLESKKIIEFIKQVLTKTGAAGIVVACSGGVDSSTSLALVVDAIGASKTYALLLPYGELSRNATNLAMAFITKLHLPAENRKTVDIAPIVEVIGAAVAIEERDTIQRGNIMARVRMIILYDFAKKHDLLVCGTENKSEYYLGYYTRFGDEASDLEPIRHLFKTQVYQLARSLYVPIDIINQKPTAGLWKNQTDEGEFGFSYQEADQVLHEVCDEGKSIEDLTQSGLQHANEVVAYVQRNDYKHRVPYAL